MKNPLLAATLSIVTGFGQIYNGQSGKGVALLMIQAVSVFLMSAYIGSVTIGDVTIGYLTTPIIWIYGVVDAYKTARRFNDTP